MLQLRGYRIGGVIHSKRNKNTHAQLPAIHLHSKTAQQNRLCIARSYDEDRPVALQSLDMLEQTVPAEQRPVNELEQLKQSALFSWAILPPAAYAQRLGFVWITFILLLGAPVAFGSFDPSSQPLEFALASATGALLVVSVITLRIFLGWSYVGNRLLSATIAYEETGWYDGQIFVKPPEILARDRLLSIYQVKPVLAKLRQTLLASAAALAFSTLFLLGVISFEPEPAPGVIKRPREINSEGIIFSEKVKSLSQLKDDDEAAEAEAAAMGGVPGYCSDRYLKAAAGGQYCSKFEGRK